MAIYKVP